MPTWLFTEISRVVIRGNVGRDAQAARWIYQSASTNLSVRLRLHKQMDST